MDRLHLEFPPGQRPILWFRRSRHEKVAWILRGLLALAIASSLWNLWKVTEQATALYHIAETIRNDVIVQPNDYPALLKDAVRLLSGTVLFAMGVVILAVAVLPVRYAVLLWAVSGSNPRTYAHVRTWSLLLIGVEAMRLMFFLSLADRYEEISVSYTPSPNGFIGAALLGYTSLPSVREHFNVFRIRQVKEARPSAATNPSDPVR